MIWLCRIMLALNIFIGFVGLYNHYKLMIILGGFWSIYWTIKLYAVIKNDLSKLD